ncbi:N-acetylglucosamine kinase [Allorhizocola rhizosphaerae]|uniref:N-acetylglucosamine kinase n=1 Tax=Allorhizocola rhizosphaerae TaxID=1872709 RepID=UPI000E3C440C|nr:BadF/BadG/BcrA/BcrD ATPase family protein [Allorhizocola rhizosphaerae]
MTETMTETVAVIDGGKSELRLLIDGPGGRWSATGPGFSYQPGIGDLTAIVSATAEAKAACGYSGPVQRLCAGLTGAPADGALREQLGKSLAELFGGAAVHVVDDGVLAHAGALDGPGTVICAGTGTVAFAFHHDGRWARADGWGYLLGDRGSGFAIGRAGLSSALAAFDGSGAPTTLVDAAAAHLGGLSVAAIQELLRAHDIPSRVASFAVVVMEHAEAGDPVARDIVCQAAQDLARTATAAARAAGLTDPYRVSYAGRLLHPGSLLESELAGYLDLVRPQGDALSGGLALAREPDRPPYHRLLATTDTTVID